MSSAIHCAAIDLGALPLDLSPLTANTASLADAGGVFCLGQVEEGAFGCDGATVNATCPGGNAPPVPDYVGLDGDPAGTLTAGAHSITLASVFCIPATGSFLLDAAAALPGPGAVSIPATVELLP